MEQYSEMVLKKTNPEEFEAKTSEMNQMKEWYKNPIMIILLTLMEILLIGIVFSLICALVLKRKVTNKRLFIEVPNFCAKQHIIRNRIAKNSSRKK